MYIFIKTLTGKTTTLDVESWDTIADVKMKYMEKEGFHIDYIKLVFAGKEADR